MPETQIGGRRKCAGHVGRQGTGTGDERARPSQCLSPDSHRRLMDGLWSTRMQASKQAIKQAINQSIKWGPGSTSGRWCLQGKWYTAQHNTADFPRSKECRGRRPGRASKWPGPALKCDDGAQRPAAVSEWVEDLRNEEVGSKKKVESMG